MDFIGIARKLAKNSIILKLDSHGLILEKHLGQISDINTHILESVFKLLPYQADIGNYFHIPANIEPEPITSDRQTLPPASDSPNRNEAFINLFRELGFFASFPTYLLALFRLPDNHLLGLVRPSNLFINILPEITIYGHFAIDSSEKLTAFNQLFISNLGETLPHPETMLGKPLSDCITPTPSTIQAHEMAALNLPDLSAIAPVSAKTSEGDLTLSAEDNTVFHLLAGPLLWDRDDLCVEFTLREGILPCLVFGDLRKTTGEVSDLEGYLMGPSYHLSGLILKKRALLLHNSLLPDSRPEPAHYRFFRLGRRFIIEKNGRIALFFSDYESILRKSVTMALYMRSGTSCRLSPPLVRIFQGSGPGSARNAFISVIARPGSYFLLSHIRLFFFGNETDAYSVFKLQDLSDVRERLHGLETEHEAAREQARKADLRVKEFLDGHDRFIGSARIAGQIRDQAEKAARSPVTILIEGPTGSGKEVLARFIHAQSAFAGGPFVKVDCSTLPASLTESLLFGHARGAFTGAVERHKGLFEQADRGTLYLDELSNLDLRTQAKLLQFLQDMAITPVGGGKPVKLNLRIIAASNLPLEPQIEKGTFRQDLFYRLAVVVLRLPPLSERMDDLQVLSEHFLKMFNLKYGRAVTDISPDAYRKLYGHGWPGNIRELKNVLERAFLFSGGSQIEGEAVIFAKDTPAAAGSGNRLRKPLERVGRSVDEVERLFLKHKGIMKRVAGELNVTRQTLYNYLKRNGIKPKNLRKNVN